MTSSTVRNANESNQLQVAHVNSKTMRAIGTPSSSPPPQQQQSQHHHSPRGPLDELNRPSSSMPLALPHGKQIRFPAIRRPKLVTGNSSSRRLQNNESGRIRTRYLQRLGLTQHQGIISRGTPPMLPSLLFSSSSSDCASDLGRDRSLRRGSIGSTSTSSNTDCTAPTSSSSSGPSHRFLLTRPDHTKSLSSMDTLRKALPTSVTAKIKPTSILRRRHESPSSLSSSLSSSTDCDDNGAAKYINKNWNIGNHSCNIQRGRPHRNKVSFLLKDGKVVQEVHIIPARTAYPPDVLDALWMRGKEYEYSVARNAVEYLSEGCDVDKVLEEEDFLPYNGRLVHPSHFLDV